MVVYTYQHTCKKSVKAYLEMHAPFKAEIIHKGNGRKSIPFLGSGYYFWEENMNAAHRWGSDHIVGDYSIIEFKDVKIPKNKLLDFGNRRDIAYFNELRQIYIEKRDESKSWPLGVWIEFFKAQQAKNEDNFPFSFFRAEENFPNEVDNKKLKQKIIFAQGKGYFTYLEPLWILCVLDKNSMVFESRSIVH